MIVVDASAAVSALLDDGAARRRLAVQQLHAPHLIDPEVASALRRLAAAGRVGPGEGRDALSVWARLEVARHPMVSLLSRIWALRDSLSAYDAAYVALAERLECGLLTADARLSRAPGLRCAVTVVPSDGCGAGR